MPVASGGNGFLHTGESLVGRGVFYVLPKPHWDDIVSDHPHPQPDQATTAAVTLRGTLRGWQGLEGRIWVSCTAPENGDGNPKGWQVWKVTGK